MAPRLALGRIDVLRGVGFGLTSGVLTTLGLIVGLNAGTESDAAVTAGIVTIAFADALSDALGLHVSQESAGEEAKSAWVTGGTTFLAKLLTALSFLLPVLLFPLTTAVVVAIVWGVILLTFLSWQVARLNGSSSSEAIAEHLVAAVVVLGASQLAGLLVSKTVGDG